MSSIQTDLAWAAGIMEGEGCIRINSNTGRNLGALMVSVSSTDYDMLEPLQAMFGGTIRENSYRASVRHRHSWRWVIAARQAAAALQAMKPYYKMQRTLTKLHLALDYQSQKRNGGSARTTRYRDRQDWYFRRMKALNTKGTARERALADCPSTERHRKR